MGTEQRPTESAFGYFNEAVVSAKRFGHVKDQRDLGVAIENLGYGLMDLSKGLRATYILLDEVKGLIQRK